MTNREVFNQMSNEDIAPAFVYCVGGRWFTNSAISDECYDELEDAIDAVVKHFESEFVE